MNLPALTFLLLGMPATDHARIEQLAVEESPDRMTAAGVPRDLLDRTLRMPYRTYELSDNDRVRVGFIAAKEPLELRDASLPHHRFLVGHWRRRRARRGRS
jgi:hypothetical protein